MTHQPITGPELQEMKQRYPSTSDGFLDIHDVDEGEFFHQICTDLPRCLQEIDRLRAALQEIYEDGVPYAYGKAAKALGIDPPPMP